MWKRIFKFTRNPKITGTFGAMWLAVNAAVLQGADTDIIINEIMYHPPLDLEELQYVELFNRGAVAVDLSKWSFTKGISFVLPDQTTLAPGAYLVVCRNRAALAANYGRDIAVAGDFTGKLSHRGEAIELCNASGKVVEAVKYSDHAPWPTGADGYSASLERICPMVSGKEAANWAASPLPPMEKPAGTPGRKNDNFSTNLPPVISKVAFTTPPPQQPATVTAEVTATDSIKTVTLLYRIAKARSETPETEVPMQRIAGDARKGTYQAAIEGQPASTLVRFRIKAVDATGTTRLQPSPNEPRPTYSFATFVNTNTARIPFAYVLNVSRSRPDTPIQIWNQRSYPVLASPTRGNGAFIYAPPDGGDVLLFDHVLVRPRKGGFKVHFPKDHAFKSMTGINVIFENSSRWLLSEPMAYEVYRLAGVPACLTEHLRTWVDGRLLGYHLLIEQPNKAFLARNQRDDTGYLYKLIWEGQGLVGQHEKKTRLASGHDDLQKVVNGLNQKSGAEQWQFIQQNFNVEEFVNYYAVNMCIQNWDGFFNNYFTYHDTARTGKWEIYPWDEDKTWGDYDGASPKYDWYEMPLTFGMNGDQAPRWNPFSRANNQPGFFGGVSWWRPAGWFSGPLLANAEFRQRFLTRLGGLCTNIFTEEKIVPLIDALEKRLDPEIPVQAQAVGADAREALRYFHSDIQSLRNQVKYRRQFILSEIPKAKAAR